MTVIHLLDDVTSCLSPSEHKQSHEGSRGWGGNGGGEGLPVVSWGLNLRSNSTFSFPVE